MTPASNNQTQPQIPRFKTDDGKYYIAVIPGTDPESIITRQIAKTIHQLDLGWRGLTVTSVVTPVVICMLPTKTYNCHGWTFACTSGRIGTSEDVDAIISGNGYTQITPTASAPAKPGDVIIYRNAHGEVVHSGIVRKVDPETGKPTEIESKWGYFERYLHPPDKVPEEYLPKDNPDTPQNEGGRIEYYRAPDSDQRKKAQEGSPDLDKDKNTVEKE